MPFVWSSPQRISFPVWLCLLLLTWRVPHQLTSSSVSASTTTHPMSSGHRCWMGSRQMVNERSCHPCSAGRSPGCWRRLQYLNFGQVSSWSLIRNLIWSLASLASDSSSLDSWSSFPSCSMHRLLWHYCKSLLSATRSFWRYSSWQASTSGWTTHSCWASIFLVSCSLWSNPFSSGNSFVLHFYESMVVITKT